MSLNRLPASSLRLAVALLAPLCALLWVLLAPGAAAAPSDTTRFDHASTGFVLTGAHRLERCESCHVGGIFKGTPTQCQLCHVQGGRVPGVTASHGQSTRTACL